jgi:DNA-damage-inducible protein D
LAHVLEYTQWRNFLSVMEKAREACVNSGIDVEDHFADVGKMIELAKGAQREIEDTELSRYACYLIVQNADPRKKVVALGQTYFAVQTRRQELQNEFNKLDENSKRLAIREEIREHNKSLAEAAQIAGVKTPVDYAVFQNKGYQGLSGGIGVKEIHKRKELKKTQKILDNMGSTELAANLFRATQTDEKLRREKIRGKERANKTHYVVGKTVRDTIKKLGGIMPEELPKPDESIQQIEKKEPQKRIGTIKKQT